MEEGIWHNCYSLVCIILPVLSLKKKSHVKEGFSGLVLIAAQNVQ